MTENSNISIHAPTKGATLIANNKNFGARNFNPRSHEGSDAMPIALVKPTPKFQSTLPRRERLYKVVVSNCHYNFNPRSHEGSDCNPDSPSHWFKLFQSTLPRRERLIGSFFSTKSAGISIHAPTKGATNRSPEQHLQDTGFQSTLPRRERLDPAFARSLNVTFQSTLPRRERPAV